MIKLADFKCEKCGNVKPDLFMDEKHVCECGGELKRMYGCRKEMQMLPHWYEHFGHEPVYVEDYAQFKKEAKKRGLEPVPLKNHLGKKRQYFT